MAARISRPRRAKKPVGEPLTDDEESKRDSGGDYIAEPDLDELTPEEDDAYEDDDESDTRRGGSKKSKGKAKATTKRRKPTTTLKPTAGPSKKSASTASALREGTSESPALIRPSKQQTYVLPKPSVNHRHRATPLFCPPGRVERLTAPPPVYGFGTPSTTPTNNFTATQAVTDRVSKAFNYNVGSGPVWELLEDRAWFKESAPSGSSRDTSAEECDTETKRRPRVHQDVRVRPGWRILDARYVLFFFNAPPTSESS
jgi:transcription factor C subunit 6